MLRSLILLFVFVVVAPKGGAAMNVHYIAQKLMNASALCGEARYVVSMAQLADDVTYSISFEERLAPTDTILPIDYLLDWTLERGDRGVHGFNAYYAGNHFRYNGDRKLQEYHHDWDSVPFKMDVQRKAQFCEVLPYMIGEALLDAVEDSGNDVVVHADTMVGGIRSVVVDVTKRVGSQTARESEYVFDAATLMPRRVTHENSPGSISEQTVEISYGDIETVCSESINEEYLMQRYTDVFERFSQSNYRIENLRGLPLPAFSLPTTTGERYTRAAKDPFRTTTLVVMMESGAGFNEKLVKGVRSGVDALSQPVDVIWVFADSHADDIESTVGSLREGEHVLMSGRGLMRDCGVAMLPTMVVVNRGGIVSDVTIGFNNDVDSDVIQKVTLIK